MMKKLYDGFDFGELLKEKDRWTPGRIDYKKLLDCFPFDIKSELLERIHL